MSQASQNLGKSADRKGRGTQTSWGQLNAILEWLEIPSNFRLITGGASQNQVIAGSKLKKTDAYRELAQAVNTRFNYDRPSEIWDAKKAKARYEAQLKKYKDIKRELSDVSGPKFCLTEGELRSGMTLEMKRDKLFPQFQRWDNLFGGRQNISPSFTMEPGMSMDFDERDTQQEDDVDERDMVILPDYDFGRDDDDRQPNESTIIPRSGALSSNTSALSSEPAQEEARIPAVNNEDQENIVNFIPPPPNPRGKKPRSSTFDVDPALVALAADSAKKAVENGDPRLSKKSKSDFTSAYAAAKSKEIDVMQEVKAQEIEIKAGRLELDRKIAEANLELRQKKFKADSERGVMDLAFARETKSAELDLAREKTDKTLKECTRRELMIALIKEGKKPEEMKEYLETLGF